MTKSEALIKLKTLTDTDKTSGSAMWSTSFMASTQKTSISECCNNGHYPKYIYIKQILLSGKKD